MKILLGTPKKITTLDNPETTIERSRILEKKVFLKKVYIEFYERIKQSLFSTKKGQYIVELGSGGGFIKSIIPGVITSDILPLPNVDLHFSALTMPFKNQTVDSFVMIDVFHHIPDVNIFLKEANRSLKKGGQIIMIEPSNTLFGKIIYKYFHHEPYNPYGMWSFISSGPLSGANSALPWIVFFRDRKKFEKTYPQLEIVTITPHTPFTYLASGGFSFIQLLPNFMYPVLSLLENLLTPCNKYIGMFYTISIIKK